MVAVYLIWQSPYDLSIGLDDNYSGLDDNYQEVVITQ